MDLDVGDCITLNVPQFGDPVKVIIESMNLNPDDYTVEMSCWTPIRSGETSPYYWAWPSQQTAHQIWPLAGDDAGGAGYNFTVTPPVDHILLGGSHRDDQLIITTGDKHPSDLDDTTPQVECELSDYLNFNEKSPEILAKEIAQSASRSNMENNITGGGNPGGVKEEKKELDECGHTGAGCNYRVYIKWHTSTRQGQATALGGPATEPTGNEAPSPCGGPCQCRGGCPSCTGPIWKVCHTFSSAWGAKMSKEYWAQQYKKSTGGYWKCSETGIIHIYIKDGPHYGAFADDCESSKSPLDPEDGTAAGETAAPIGTTGVEPNIDW
jgi:hypothetical protein